MIFLNFLNYSAVLWGLHRKNLVVGSHKYRAHKQILLVYTEKSGNTVDSVHKKNLWGSTNTGPTNRFFLCTHPTNRIFLCTEATGLLNNSKKSKNSKHSKNIKRPYPPSGRGGCQSARLTGSSLYRGDALSPPYREGVCLLYIQKESLSSLYIGETLSPLYREGVSLFSI